MAKTAGDPSSGTEPQPAPPATRGPAPLAARDALRAQLRATEAQALRIVRDFREVYALERQRRRDLEISRAHLLRLLKDLKAAHRAERARRRELAAAHLQTLRLLAHAVELKDDYTGGHIERVRRYSLAIADALALDAATRRQLEMGAELHDVGKLGVPDAVLGKHGRLTAPEWSAMRTHPERGIYLLHGVSFLADALDAVEAHHERWDGRGYPHGLRAHDIPLLGRIVAVADAFDAMTSDRPYRRGLPAEAAAAELERGRGTQFDPDVVEAFLRAWRLGVLPAPAAAPATTTASRPQAAAARPAGSARAASGRGAA